MLYACTAAQNSLSTLYYVLHVFFFAVHVTAQQRGTCVLWQFLAANTDDSYD